jgi:hypothetical protein
MMRDDNQSSVIANAYLKMLQDRFAPKDEAVVEETPVVDETPTEEPKEEGTQE